MNKMQQYDAATLYRGVEIKTFTVCKTTRIKHARMHHAAVYS